MNYCSILLLIYVCHVSTLLPGNSPCTYIAVAHVCFSCSTSVRDCWKRSEQSLIGVPVAVAMRPATTNITTAFHSILILEGRFLGVKKFSCCIVDHNYFVSPDFFYTKIRFMLSMHNYNYVMMSCTCCIILSVHVLAICCLPLAVSLIASVMWLLVLLGSSIRVLNC